MDRRQLDKLRNQADQAGCPCLILRESKSVPVVTGRSVDLDKTKRRLELVARAAHRLGCNAVSLQPEPFNADTQLEEAAKFLRQIMDRIDRMEMNMLIEPGKGVLAEPERLIELIKKVAEFTMRFWRRS